MNIIETINNDIFGSVRTLDIDDKYYFVASDVAKALGHAKPNNAINAHCKHMIKQGIIDDYGNEQQMNIIPESDVLLLIQKSKVRSVDYKTSFKDWLLSEGVISGEMVIESRKEIEFVDQLEEALKPFGIKGQRQYNVLSYKIDYYIESLNIAIEYDEKKHDYYSYEEQEGRQEKIEKELGCRFIRVSEEYSNSYNIGLVIKQILLP